MMRMVAIAGLLGLGLLVPTLVHADAATDEYNLAVNLYKQNRWADAAGQFQSFLKAHAQHEKVPFARLYLGLALVNQEEYKTAREQLRQFVKDYPNNKNLPQAKFRVAECSYLLNDHQAALGELQTYLKDHPEDVHAERAWPYLGDTQLSLKDAQAALASFEKAIEKFPQGTLFEDSQFGRARALEALQKYDDAIAQFQAIAKHQSGARAADAQFALAARQFDLKRYADSASAYQRFVMDFPDNAQVVAARLNGGTAFYRAGQFADAAKLFEQAAQDPTQQAEATYWQGMCWKSAGDPARAVRLLTEAAKLEGERPAAARALFQAGLTERQAGHPEAALTHFETVRERWPTHEFADDSLYAAAEITLEAGDLNRSQTLLERFQRDYPGSGLRMHAELLAGRLELSRAAELESAARPAGTAAADAGPLYARAAQRFEKAMQESTVSKTKLHAQYYLALTRQLQKDYAKGLELIGPLVTQAQQDGGKSDFGDALIVQAECLYQLHREADAETAAARYNDLYPRGRQRARALSLMALSAAAAKNSARSDAARTQLAQQFPKHPLVLSTTLQLADLAEKREDWPAAESLYRALVSESDDLEHQAFCRRGEAWALYRQKKFTAAATKFGSVLTDFPQQRLAPECGYYQGESLREAGDFPAAAAVFGKVLRAFAPAQPPATGAEQQPPLVFAYRAGLQQARSWKLANKTDAADEAYGEVAKLFPRAQNFDKLLNEWALLNYEAERFDRSDALFQRLITEAPTSDLADNAQLSLAESDLLAGKLSEARVTFEKLVAAPNSDAEVKERASYQLLLLATEQQRWADVRTLADRFQQQFPQSPLKTYAVYAVAESLIAPDTASPRDLQTAREQLQSLRSQQADPEVGKAPWFGRVFVLQAELAYREKKYEEAERIATQFRETDPTSPYLYQADEVLGRCFKQQAKFPEARAAFQRTLDDPQSTGKEIAAKAQFLIAETYYLSEQWPAAFLEYQKVYANHRFPEWQAAALLQSAKCDEQRGQWKAAAATYGLLLKEFPQSTHANEARERQKAAKTRAGG